MFYFKQKNKYIEKIESAIKSGATVLDLKSILIENYSNNDFKNLVLSNGLNVLQASCLYGNEDLVSYFIDLGLDPHIETKVNLD